MRFSHMSSLPLPWYYYPTFDYLYLKLLILILMPKINVNMICLIYYFSIIFTKLFNVKCEIANRYLLNDAQNRCQLVSIV